MNILVINGSPKGQNSITLQTTNYLKIFIISLKNMCFNDIADKIGGSEVVL